MNNWVPVDTTLRNHPKLARLARRLGISRAETVGHLVLLWTWALDYAPDGGLSGFDAEELADAAMYDGEPLAFATALVDCHFIDADEDGMTLHDWEEYGGRLAQYREANRDRQRRHRTQVSLPRDVTVTSRERHSTVTGESRVEGSREEIARVIDVEHDNGAIAPPSPSRKSRKEPKVVPSAVLKFRDATSRFPAKSWYDRVANAVGEDDDSLVHWFKTCEAWVGLGRNPSNVQGMLECFARGEIPSNGRTPVHAQAGPSMVLQPDGSFRGPVGSPAARGQR